MDERSDLTAVQVHKCVPGTGYWHGVAATELYREAPRWRGHVAVQHCVVSVVQPRRDRERPEVLDCVSSWRGAKKTQSPKEGRIPSVYQCAYDTRTEGAG